MVDLAIMGALALDAAVGWPVWLYRRAGHPVGLFAALIVRCERHWNQEGNNARHRRLTGIATVLLLLAGAGGAGWLVEYTIRSLLGYLAWPLIALAAWPAIAQRSLHTHVYTVFEALKAEDLPAARQAVGMIVGRDTDTLEADGIACAAIESLAESFCDGIVAPVFWLIVAGLPGIWMYKAINTADSLIGHPEPSLRAFGWASARMDDVINFLPARIAGILLCLGGGGGWGIMKRDHAQHASPNAGWPESAMAGVLGVRLAGPTIYDGITADKPWIGNGPLPNAGAVAQALAVYVRACGIMWIAATGLIWAF